MGKEKKPTGKPKVTTRVRKTSKSGQDNFSKAKFLEIYTGYDFLENLGVTMAYMTKKHGIDTKLLHLLIHLMGHKKGITIQAYEAYPKSLQYTKIDFLVQKGWVNLFQEAKNKRNNIYTLSSRGKNFVIEFYELLAGVQKFSQSSKINPMAKADAGAYDKKRNEVLKILNSTPMKDYIGDLYTNNY